MNELKLTFYHQCTEPYFDERDGTVKRSVFVTRTARLLEIDETTWQAISCGALKNLEESHIEYLFAAELLVSNDENELELILSQNDNAAQNPRTLYQVIQPSANCQLGCWYCPQKHFSGQLSNENQDLLVERIHNKLKNGSYEEIEVCWFGAEPIMGLPTIRSLSPRLQALAADFKIKYKSKMVTNGLALTEEVATELVTSFQVGFFEVTIDGTGEHHDAVRHTKSGRPTFKRILDNVVNFAKRDDLDAAISVRCNVDHANRDGVTPLIRMLADAGVQDRVAKFYISPIYNWGDNDAGDSNAPRQQFSEWEVEWFVELIRLGFNVSLLPQRNRINCLAMRGLTPISLTPTGCSSTARKCL